MQSIGLRGSSEFVWNPDLTAEANLAQRAPFAVQNMKAIVFDLDRHLIDTDAAFSAYWTGGLTALSAALGLDSAVVEPWLEAAQQEFKTIFFFHRLKLVGTIRVAAASKGLNIKHLSSDVFAAADSAYRQALGLRQDVLVMLMAAQNFAKSNGAQMVLMTGGSKSHTVQKLHRLGIAPYFDAVFCAGNHPFEDDSKHGYHTASSLLHTIRSMPEGVTKRNPTAFAWVLKQLSVSPEQAMNSGDHPQEDVQNMQVLGGYAAQSFYFNNKPHPDVVPDILMHSPNDLTQVFLAATK